MKIFAKSKDQVYWYFTKHGVMPGSVPKDIDILDIIDTPHGAYFATSVILTTDALDRYDIQEKAPTDEEY